jgi:hypothetical protein
MAMEGFAAGRNRNVDEESGHMGSRRGQRVLSQRVSGVWGGGTDLNVPVSARIRFGPFWEACSAEASVLLFLFLKRWLRGKSFFSLSCSPERLRSSSEFLFLPAANPDLRSSGGLSPMRSHALPATHAMGQTQASNQRHAVDTKEILAS